MANTSRHQISPGQLFVFLLTTQIGIGILELPRLDESEAGHSGWMALIPIGLATLVCAYICWKVCRYFNASIITINRRVLGRFLGGAANWLIVGLLIASSVANAGLFSQAIMILFFRETPTGALAVALIMPSFYIIAKGLKVLARFDSFVFMAIASLFGLFIAVYSSLNWNFILPLLPHHWVKAFIPTPALIFSFIGFNLVLVIYPYLNPGKKSKSHLLYMLGALSVTMVVYVLFAIVSTALFGEEFVRRQVITLLDFFRRIEIPVLERMDIFFAAIWLPAMGASFTSFLMATDLALEQIFPQTSAKVFPVVVTVATVIGILLFRGLEQIENLSTWVGITEFFGLGLLWPLFVWLVGRLRGVKT